MDHYPGVASPPAEINADLPPQFPMGHLRLGDPTQVAEAGGTIRNTNLFTFVKPMLGRGLLRVSDGAVVLFVTQKPSKSHGWLKRAIDHRRVGSAFAFAWMAARQQRVLGRISIAAARACPVRDSQPSPPFSRLRGGFATEARNCSSAFLLLTPREFVTRIRPLSVVRILYLVVGRSRLGPGQPLVKEDPMARNHRLW